MNNIIATVYSSLILHCRSYLFDQDFTAFYRIHTFIFQFKAVKLHQKKNEVHQL
jgi:hypothetical protein